MDSFWVNGPYHAIMKAIQGDSPEGSYSFSLNTYFNMPGSETSTGAPYTPTPQSLISNSLTNGNDPHQQQMAVGAPTTLPIMPGGQSLIF